jgi:hypothetical protein
LAGEDLQRSAQAVAAGVGELEVGLRFTVAVLATWRVAHLLAFEDGPFDAIARLRAAAGRFGGVLDCFFCLSLWVAAPLALWVTDSLLAWVCVALATSGGACLLHRLSSPPVVMQPFSEGATNGMLRTEASGGSGFEPARELPPADGHAAAGDPDPNRSCAN